MEAIVQQVVEAYGGMKAAMTALDVTTEQAVNNWRRRGIPLSKIQKIHRDTGIPLADLFARTTEAESDT